MLEIGQKLTAPVAACYIFLKGTPTVVGKGRQRNMSFPSNVPTFRLDGESRPSTSLEHPVLRELERKGELNQALRQKLARTDEPAAFSYLVREITLEVLNDCLNKIRDEEVAIFVVDSAMLIASVLASEAFSGIERRQGELRAYRAAVPLEPSKARQIYDRHVEELGRYVFALDRRLQQVEDYYSRCRFSGSAEVLRGRYGQCVRDLASGLRFLREDLNRWVRRFVPLEGELAAGDEGRRFLEARIDSVVDDLGLRLKEIREGLSSALFDQLSAFEPSLTRKQVFKCDLENLLDIDAFTAWLSELIQLVRRYDERREPETLALLKAQLTGFEADRFPALTGVRESDQRLFASCAERIRAHEPNAVLHAEDPIQVFLLLLGDLFKSLSQRQAQTASIEISPE